MKSRSVHVSSLKRTAEEARPVDLGSVSVLLDQRLPDKHKFAAEKRPNLRAASQNLRLPLMQH